MTPQAWIQIASLAVTVIAIIVAAAVNAATQKQAQKFFSEKLEEQEKRFSTEIAAFKSDHSREVAERDARFAKLFQMVGELKTKLSGMNGDNGMIGEFSSLCDRVQRLAETVGHIAVRVGHQDSHH